MRRVHRSLIFFIAILSVFSSYAADTLSLNGQPLPRPVETEAGISARRAFMRDLGSPEYIEAQSSYQKSRSYNVLAATALKGCGPIEWPAYMASLSTLPVGYPPDGPVEMFSLPPLVRYLYQFGDCMSPAQKQQLLDGFTSQKERLTAHGTLNHAIMRATSWYLLAQYFPNANWTDGDGKVYTSQQLMAELKRLLAERDERFYKSGHYEMLAPTYAMINIFPLLNLIDFAVDPEVKKTAEKEAALEIAVLGVHSFHGVIVPPLTRYNVDQHNAMDSPQKYIPAVSQDLLWYYFGEPENLGLYDFQNGKEPFYATMFGLSRWLPPAEILNLNLAKTAGYNIKMITPGFGIWGAETKPEIYGDAYITDNFAVATSNQIFDPGGYSGHIETFSILLKSDKPQNQIECYNPFWHSNAGEDAWGSDRSSPFQQMYRYDTSSVIMLFNIPKTDPWILGNDNHAFAERNQHANNLLQLAECRIPNSFDEILKDDNWIFVRQGGVFVAIATMLGSNQYDDVPIKLTSKYLIVKIREPKTALFFRVDRQTPELSFAQFIKKVRKQLPVYDASNSSVSLTEQSGVHTQVKFNIHPDSDGKRWAAIPLVLKNGKPVLQDNSYVIESPVMTLKNGVLDIKQ